MRSIFIALVLSACVAGAQPSALPVFGPDNAPPPTLPRYNYGPSILFDAAESKWKIWWCSVHVTPQGTQVAGDAVWYSDSYDAVNWSTAQIVFVPALKPAWDSFHICDPNVLRNVTLAGQMRAYVMFYTGADGLSGGDNNGQTGVAVSQDGRNWTRLQKLTLECQTTLSLGCQHFSAIKLRANTPDPAFGGRFVATYSQSKPDGSSGTYVVESPDGLNWWGNAGAPGSAPRRLTFPDNFYNKWMSAGIDLMYDMSQSRFLMTFTGTAANQNQREHVFSFPAHWYGGLDGSAVGTLIASYTVSAQGSFVPGWFRAGDGYRPGPLTAPWEAYTMTSDRDIRGSDGAPRQTRLLKLPKWF